MGDHGKVCSYTDRCNGADDSHEEGHQILESYHVCHEGLFDPSLGREVVGQRDVQGSSGFVPE
jgi:hypothetical protein